MKCYPRVTGLEEEVGGAHRNEQWTRFEQRLSWREIQPELLRGWWLRLCMLRPGKP